ncbi:O-antigen ligase family protein [Desulfobacterota bacterium M19]
MTTIRQWPGTQHIVLFPFILALAAIIFLPSYHPLTIDCYDEKRVISLIILLSSAVSYLISPRQCRDVSRLYLSWPRWVRAALPLIFLLGIISSLRSFNPLFALVEVGNFALLLLFGLQVAIIRSTYGKIIDLAIILSFVLFAVLYLLDVSASIYAMFIVGSIVSPFDLFNNFLNPRFFNQLQSTTFPFLLIAPFLFPRHIKFTWPLFIVPAGWWTLALVAGGRGVTLATLIGLTLTVCLFPTAWKKWLISAAAVLSAGTIGARVLDSYILDFMARGPHTIGLAELMFKGAKNSDRAALWHSSIKMIRKSPLLGRGPMHFAHLHHPVGAHPHNFILQLGCEWGIIVTVLFLLISCCASQRWFIQIHRFYQSKRRDESASLVYLAVTSSILAIAAHSLVTGNFVMPLSQLTIFMVIGWALGIFRDRADESRPLSSPQPSYFILFSIIIMAVLFIVYAFYPDFTPFKQWIARTMTQNPGILHPRFWSQGYF